jgi:serine protease Do/serine protease DegQ
MRVRSAFLTALVIVFGVSGTMVARAETIVPFTNEAGEPTLAPIIKEIAPAVVNIATVGSVEQGQENPLLDDPFFDQFLPNQPQGQMPTNAVGSGVIVDAEEGYIITNHHVIANADEIMVTLTDRRQLEAELVGSDPETDIAVLKVDPLALKDLEFGNSDNLEVGDFVVAVGNPFGLGQTVTLGIVSAVGRSGLGIEGYEDFIQTDASINPGNSGGALVTLSGDVIGINTAILGRSGNIGIGFAIPINMARNVMEQIIEHGSVQRGLLGVNIQDLTHDLANAMGIDTTSGALVSRVFPDSAAAEAGVQEGDVIVGINDIPVADAADLRNAVGLMRIGETADLSVVRGDETLDIAAVIAPREDIQMASAEVPAQEPAMGPSLAGATFGPIDPMLGYPDDVTGAQVLTVEPNSEAYRAGLREGDVVDEINREPVTNSDDLIEKAEGAGDKLLLHVRRGEAAFYVMI